MALTDAEKTELKNDILNTIKAESQGVNELAEATSLDNIKSLPALRGTELVSAPLSLLGKPATDAAALANAAATKANNAATNAAEATSAANNAAATANEKAGVAVAAAGTASEATKAAQDVVATHGNTALAALKGAAARFDAIVETGAVELASSTLAGGRIVWMCSVKNFVYDVGGKYYLGWAVTGVPSVSLYHDGISLLKDKVYLCGDTLYVWSDEEDNLVEVSGNGSGSGYYNVTLLHPLSSGYYTKDTAVAALAGADIDDGDKRGMVITFESAAGEWEDYRFIGTDPSTFLNPGAWEEHGAKGAVKSVTVNGEKKSPDAEGNVALAIDKVEVDGSLDPDSTNPVQNAAVSAKLSELEAGTIFGADAELNDDESTVRLTLTNKSGAEVVSVDLPAGSGSGGGDTATARIVLGASVDNATVKEGGSVKLTWSYDHQYTAGDEKGESTGQKATVQITVRRGATTTYDATTQDVSKGTYTLDLTKYLLLGTSDIYVVATATDPSTGKAQKKQAYVSVKSVTLGLSSSYTIPYAVTGTGTKTVTLYVDGKQKEAHSVTRSGTTNGTFSLGMSGLSVGRHTVQMVAEMEADGLTLKSESVYMDILKRGSSAPFIGTKITHADGRILTGTGHTVPTIGVGQYEQCSFSFVAYDPAVVPATVEIWRNGSLSRSVSVPRSVQSYTNRFTEKGTQTLQLKLGATAYTLRVEVTESGVDIAEASYGLLFKLDAAGRSNEESNPAVWEAGGVKATFENVDWSSSGWTGNALKLVNGAKATIGYKPFATDVKSAGLTIEITMKVSNVTDRSAAVVSCIDNGKGLLVTTQEAGFRTGQTVTYTNEEDEQVTREVKLATNYADGEEMKVALMVGTTAENRLMQLYVNGNRTGADLYDTAFNFQQDTPRAITIDSSGADVEIRCIRVYNRALSDDEELENAMVDADGTDTMMALYEENDILGDTGDVDLDKLLAQGKGVLRIVRQNKLDDVYAENNKKTDFSADIFYYSPFGSEYDFVLRDCYIRIQGTSSTKYPSKNIRIYISKGGTNLSFTVGGKEQAEKKYPVRPGGIAMNLICLKSDYSDSSMSLNTGGAKLFNDVLKEMGLLTPPQRYQYETGGSDLNAVTVRTAIDGVPIDMFVAAAEDGENNYVGQYNFNNEKSKSGDLFGLSGVEGYDPACPLTLEMLNNTEAMCLFKTTSDAHLEEVFDAGAETNVPDDVKWAGLDESQRTAVKRLYAWIRSCVPDGATSADLSTFKSEKFRDEISDYFDKAFLLTYYLWTDYFLAVDQRAKNMMLRTWDGLIWYITYYDGDTQMGKRNDCFLVYDYTTDRDTYDAEAGKYAFEGRDSWLWNLVLANLDADLKTQAQALRGVLTTSRVLDMLNVEQAGNWCDRAYNKSGELKYILPATQEMYGKVWPFIYALQGSNRAHREYFVRNRFALLDAKYGTSNFTSDNIDLYLARTAADTPDVLKITANEVYAFGYGTNNSPNIGNTGIIKKDAAASLSITGAYTVNDPLRVYGASRMKVLDMSGAADHLKNAFDLGKCTVLRELNLQSSGNGSTGWWLNIGNCKQLRKLNLRNQAQAKTGGSTSTELDLSAQTKLEELEARGTQVQSVVLAKGSPVTLLHLPGTLTSLRLEYLGRLTTGGLTLESYSKVKTFIFDSCPGIDWETLLGRCTGVERIRVTGIDREDDGTWLDKFVGMGGVDSDGNTTDTCALVGTVQLTRYIDDDTYSALKAHFPELNIRQPEYTMIEFDDEVSDDANVSNLDNGTGYKYDNAYEVSGHISAILKQRHRVLAKVTKKATTRGVNMANVDTTVNNLDGEMTYYPLDDTDSNKYADGTAARLDGTEGDWMMYEPFFWSKGINDYLNGKHYSCYSSNGSDNMPSVPDADVLTLDDIKGTSGGYLSGRKIMSGKDTLSNSYSTDSTYSVCKVNVDGYKRVRFPSVPGTSLVGSIFTDDSGTVISSIVVPTLSNKFEAGMYLIADVPEGATALHFSILNTAEFDKVVLSNSDRIEDMEPEWVPNDEHLCAVVGSSVVGSKLRACITGGSTTASMTWADFHYYSVQRGMQQIDALMHSRIANLFYAKYGRRDSQEQCGAGSHTNSRTTGGTASRGMTDTIGYEEASSINPNVTNSLIENSVHQYAWYREKDDYGGATVTQVNNICCLGYEDIYGHKYDMMDGVDLPNDTGNSGKWRIWMPDGSTRLVKGSVSSGIWITAVAHGKYMDVIPVGSVSGSSSTNYCDIYYISTASSRVVYRGVYYASPNGGVSMSYAHSDSSYTYTYIGSRLAFRGRLVKASSAVAFKAISEVA